MEKPNSSNRSLEQEELSLADLAGLISIQTQDAMERGSFYDPQAASCGSLENISLAQSYTDSDIRSTMFNEEGKSKPRLMLTI